MKKTFKKVLSVILAVMLLCSMLSFSALADDDPPAAPSVTVYVTQGLFDAGGYDEDEGEPAIQKYIGGNPSNNTNNYFNTVLGVNTVEIADIPSMKTLYGNPTSVPYTPNVLDAIMYVLTTTETEDPADPAGTKYTPYGGWDTFNSPNGGYINSFSPEGGTTYGPTYQDI